MNLRKRVCPFCRRIVGSHAIGVPARHRRMRGLVGGAGVCEGSPGRERTDTLEAFGKAMAKRFDLSFIGG